MVGIPDQANESNVNWKEFLGDKPWRDFDPDMYFNWQKWFEFGTGPAGNQFTHEFDGVNQVMELGIPKTVMASGGKYYFKDPRNIPDVFNVVLHYPQKGLSLTYDCTYLHVKEWLNFIRNGSMPSGNINKGFADFLNQWGVVLIGISLMLGLLSRWGCLGGMFLLGLYYFANPILKINRLSI